MFGTGAFLGNWDGFYQVGKVISMGTVEGDTLNLRNNSAYKHKGVMLTNLSSTTIQQVTVWFTDYNGNDTSVNIALPVYSSVVNPPSFGSGAYILPCVISRITTGNSVNIKVTLLN
jgi:hypothetical protein